MLRASASPYLSRPRGRSSNELLFEIVGDTGKLDAFIRLMEPLGLADVSRTDVVAISRGVKAMDVAY